MALKNLQGPKELGRRWNFVVPRSQRQLKREHTGRFARELAPSELSSAVRIASQGARKNDLRMWREYGEAVLFHAGALQPNHMAFIANGFARAEVPDKEVFDRMSDSALNRVEDFEPRDMALFLNAYAKLQFRDLALFKIFASTIRRSPSNGFGEQQLSLLCNAYARLEIADGELFKQLSGWICQRVVELSPQGIASIANAYAKVLFPDATLFGALREGIGRNLEDLKAQHVANLLNAYVRLEFRDELALRQLALKIPGLSRQFRPLELSQALHAVVKLSMASEQRKALLCLSEAVQERAEDLNGRQLALTLHAFSVLTTSHEKIFQKLAPQVLANSMADHQSAAMIFCAYARAGHVDGKVIEYLTSKLLRGVDQEDQQMQVQLFYACGRLGLHQEPLMVSLAQLLRPQVATMSGQHLANCLLALSRLSLCHEPLAHLQAALQARLLRKDASFSPQQLANCFHALAGIYGEGAPLQRCPTPLPGTLLPRLIELVVALGDQWEQHTQLVASIAVSCARLRHPDMKLFTLVGRQVQGGSKLSKQMLSEVLAAFAVTGFFDLDLFSSILSQLDSGGLTSISMDCLLRALHALDLASFGGSASASETIWTEGSSLLFPQCPSAFQLKARYFYERLALTMLVHSQTLRGKLLEEVAPAFARAGLLHDAVPFDLLSQDTLDFFWAAGSGPPLEPSLAPTSRLPDEAEHSISLLALILEELNVSQPLGLRYATLLGKYAKLLPEEGSQQASVPSTVLDPILRRLGSLLRDSASSLSFADLGAASAALADAGIRPADVLQALAAAAAAMDFPKASAQAVAVGDLVYGLAAGGQPLTALNSQLQRFLRDLVEGQSSLGSVPIKTVARLLAAADEEMRADLAPLQRQALREPQRLEDLMDFLRVLGTSGSLDDAELELRLLDACAAAPAARLLELLQVLTGPAARSHELLSLVARQLLQQAQALGPPGLAFALQAFGRLRALNIETPGAADGQDGLPRLLAGLLRSLLVFERRLSVSEAVQAAHFCAQAMDCPALAEADRTEARDGLARLLGRLSWERQRWSLEDRKQLTEVATLLRSEYPELLQSKWVPRSVISTLEVLR